MSTHQSGPDDTFDGVMAAADKKRHDTRKRQLEEAASAPGARKFLDSQSIEDPAETGGSDELGGPLFTVPTNLGPNLVYSDAAKDSIRELVHRNGRTMAGVSVSTTIELPIGYAWRARFNDSLKTGWRLTLAGANKAIARAIEEMRS